MGQVKEDRVIQFETLKKVINKGDKAAIAKALIEDEQVRLASQKRSFEYLNRVENEKNEMPNWMWNALYFALGVLVTLSVPSWSMVLHNVIKYYNGGVYPL